MVGDLSMLLDVKIGMNYGIAASQSVVKTATKVLLKTKFLCAFCHDCCPSEINVIPLVQ